MIHKMLHRKRLSNTNLTKYRGEHRCSERVGSPAPRVARVVLLLLQIVNEQMTGL
jgi:hypothetical protein